MIYETAFKFLELYAPNCLHLADKIAKRNVADEHSWFWFDPEILDRGDRRPLVLIYSSCHANQIRTYIREVRKDLGGRFKLAAVMTHQLQLDFDQADRGVIDGLFAAADFLFVNVLADKFGFTATSNFLKHRKPGSHVITFVPPTFAAFWPVCVPFGEAGVLRHMEDGLDANKMVELFHAGEFLPCFATRYVEQIGNLSLREKDRDVKLSDFIRGWHQKVKMFFSFNHPSFHTIAHLSDNLLEKAGYGKYDLDRVLSVDTNGGRFGNHYPETKYEFEFYGFHYPIRWPNDRGGLKFYEQQIRESYVKQLALKAKGEEEYCNPLDDL